MISGREKVRAVKIAAVIISLAGLCLIVWSPDMEIKILGVVFALACAGCYTIYTISLSSESVKEFNSLVTAGYVLAASAIFNFGRCLISGRPLFTENISQLAYMLLLAVVCAFAAILFFCLGVKLIATKQCFDNQHIRAGMRLRLRLFPRRRRDLPEHDHRRTAGSHSSTADEPARKENRNTSPGTRYLIQPIKNKKIL